MPDFIRAYAQWLLQKWFLPQQIIIKEQVRGKEEQFDHELQILELLHPLQGRYIPQCFGTAISDDNSPAIVLEHIDGQTFDQLSLEQLVNPALPPSAQVSNEELIHPQLLLSLRTMYGLLTQHGVVHGDPELHNFIWTKTGIKAVDFGLSSLLPCDVTNEHELRTILDRLALVVDTKYRSAWIESRVES